MGASYDFDKLFIISVVEDIRIRESIRSCKKSGGSRAGVVVFNQRIFTGLLVLFSIYNLGYESGGIGTAE